LNRLEFIRVSKMEDLTNQYTRFINVKVNYYLNGVIVTWGQ